MSKPDQESLTWAMGVVARAMREGAFAEIQVKVKAGKIVMATRSDTMLPPTPGRTVQETGRS